MYESCIGSVKKTRKSHREVSKGWRNIFCTWSGSTSLLARTRRLPVPFPLLPSYSVHPSVLDLIPAGEISGPKKEGKKNSNSD